MFLKEGYWSKRVEVQRTAAQSSDLNIHLISQEYGTDTGMYHYWINIGTISVPGQLRTYPSPNSTLTLTCLSDCCCVREGVGA